MALYFIHSACGADTQSGSIQTENPISTHEEYNELIRDYESKVKNSNTYPVIVISLNRLD